ncbi:MAG: CHAT domain-containing tetratricopeptide repeat protein [Bryobacteraceae bacterium]
MWMLSCGILHHAPDHPYREAESLFQTGDFRTSLEKARQGLRNWPAGDWGWKFRLLAAEDLSKISHAPEARSLLETAGAPLSPGLLARWKMDRANLAGGSTQLKLLREALPLATASRDPAVICMVELYLGEVLWDRQEAAAHIQAAFAAAGQAHDDFLLTWVQLARGFNSMRFSRFDEALSYFDEALATGRRCGAHSLIAAIIGNKGWCYYRLGDFDRAMDALTDAESRSASLGQPDWRHRWLGAIGLVYFARGDFDRAESFEQRAAKLAEEVGNPEWQAIAWHNLAQMAIEKRDLPGAQSYSAKELAIRQHGGDASLLVSSELTVAEIEDLLGEYPQAEKDYLAVISQAQRVHAPDVLWEAYGYLASFYADRGNRKKAAERYRDAIGAIDREWNNLSTDESKTTFLTVHLVGLFQDYVDFLIKTGRMEEALEIAESARARILSLRLERLGALPPNLDLAGLQRAAEASHTVILSYWLEPARASVWVIGAGRIARFGLPPGNEIGALVRKHIEAVTLGRDPLVRSDASALYQAVLGPVAKMIPAGSNVIVVPDGELHQLNFETLVVPGPPPHYWIEDVSLATAPSLRVLAADAHKTVGPPRLLIMGDPVLVGQEFGPLPNAKKEISAVEECFPAANRVAFTGASATPAQYLKGSPGGFTHIHFATHAVANLESPLNSAIILSHQGESYKLYARDVAAMPLHADLVTLSACRSAGAKAYSGEGLMGFAWAFLQAGSQNVIATLWDADDAASADLMPVLYKDILAGQTPARALRTSKLALMRSGGLYRLPYYWGPLQVFTRELAPATTTAAMVRR